MGYVLRLKRNQLVGGNNNDEIYPITATNAVYREGGKNLEDILTELGGAINRRTVVSFSYEETPNSGDIKGRLTVTYSTGDTESFDVLRDKASKISVTANNPTLEAGSTKTIGNINDTNLNVIIPNFVLNNGGIPKIQYISSKSTFDNITKDSDTLYFIPVDE